MLASGGGSIVNNASQLGVVGMGTVAPYVSAKHAVVGLSRTAALELAQQNVRVNVITPAGVDTPLFRSTMGATPEGAAHIAGMHPVNRVAQPEEIASFVAYLLSDETTFITGSALSIDGGWTAQ
jgi:NAD(P)-dependent dehydrogenase (short-subunit alcohol dehydrogenase family)